MASFAKHSVVVALVLVAACCRPSAASRIVNGLASDEVSEARNATLHPVVIVGPLLGQTLLVKDSRWAHPCSKLVPAWETAWIGLRYTELLCAVSGGQLDLAFDEETNLTSPFDDDIEVKEAESWEGLKVAGKEPYRLLVERLVKHGYVKGENILAQPYDWRLGVADWRLRIFPTMRRSIEAAKRKSGLGVVLTGISMAGPFNHAFLSWARKTAGPGWLAEHVHAFVPVGAPFNGAVNALSSLLGGALTAFSSSSRTFENTKFTCPQCSPALPEHVKASGFFNVTTGLFANLLHGVDHLFQDAVQSGLTSVIRTMPSIFWMSTNVDSSTSPPTDDVAVEFEHQTVLDPSKTFTEAVRASQMPALFRRFGLYDEAALFEYALSEGTTTDPGVPVHCVYSTNVRTFTKLAFRASMVLYNERVELGDGDGTVHLGSLSVCDRWPSTRKTYRIPGVPHMSLLTVSQILDVVVAAATEDTQALEAWKTPEYDDLDVLDNDFGEGEDAKKSFRGSFLVQA